MVEYDRHQQVQGGPPGERVRLRLQTRHLDGVDPFHCVCWRTCYSGTSSNRRFYMTDGAPWTTRATTVLALLTAAEHAGMLGPELDDPFQRWGGGTAHHLASLGLDRGERLVQLGMLTIDEQDALRWRNGHFIVGTEPSDTWKKVLLVDWGADLVTFRSTTSDLSYRPAKVVAAWGDRWRLDNAMQDVSTATARAFLHLLCFLAQTPPGNPTPGEP